jgi:hypothetical protein
MRSLAPVALAALIMLPRLASPHFGLLDDGLTLQTGREVSGRWWSVLYLIPETGRFFPAYWLSYSLVFAVVGARPLAFFAVNLLLFAGLLAMLAKLARLTGATRGQAAVAALLLAVSGPAIETFYTLSKAEPLQLTWIGLSLLATAASVSAARTAARAALFVAAATALLLAHATKETSVVLVPIAFGWLAFEWWTPKKSPTWARFAIAYVLINLLAVAAFGALRWQYAALALGEGTYTRAYVFQTVTIGPALFRICAWLARGFAYLLPLLALAALPRVGGRRPIVYACVWMAGWLAVFLPWPATFEYYLLPFAFGAALLGGTLAGDAWRWRGPEQPVARRRLASGALATAALLLVATALNAATDARVQLTVDRADADLVAFLGGLPPGSHVLANMSPVNEYHYELPMHLSELKGRRDIVVERMPPPARASAADAFVITAEMANQPGPTVRIALHEPGVSRDNATLRTLLAADSAPVYRGGRQTRIVEIGLQRLLCPFAVRPVLDITYCPRDRGVLDGRTFSYGWQVHRLVRPVAGPPA